MKTKALYLHDPYQKQVEAEVIEVIPEAAGVWRVVLDQTVFYPMGGGQPTDQGTLSFASGHKGEVYQVLLKDGEIHHYVRMERAPEVGEKLVGEIDWERRYKNMKVHAAGHVIDFAMHILGYSPVVLKPIKGDHGKKPYIVYQGHLDGDIKLDLEEVSNSLVREEKRFTWSFESLEALQKRAIYLQPGLPTNKPLRSLHLEGVGAVADGGTIVANTREVGPISILSIDTVDGHTHVKYQVI
jgi:alanyl-tRNA synthetase